MALAGCTTSRPALTPHDGLVTWTPVDSLDALLPPDVRVFAGTNGALPLRAWLVRVGKDRPFRVEVSDDTTDVRESTSSFAHDAGACVAVNGGYFRMGDFPASAVGLLVQNGRVTADATMEMTMDEQTYPTVRAALGRMPDGRYEIGWVSQTDTLLRLASTPAAPETSRPWHPAEGLGAGPMLLQDGQYRVTAHDEGFMSTSIPRTHPRTAAGVAANGDLLLLVVDGRQEASRGVNLQELARLMRDAGAVDALNLDGGGSSTLVVRGALVNRPTGGTFEREVMNALVAFCE